MSDRPPVDPRYDARFQRGYTGEAPAKPAAQRGSRAAWPTPRQKADPARLIQGPPRVVAPTVHIAEASDDGHESAAEPLPTNPWALTLLIVSGAMVLGGVGVAWYTATNPAGPWGTGTPMIELLMIQLGWVLPQGLFLAGSVGLLARLALAALWWGDRR